MHVLKAICLSQPSCCQHFVQDLLCTSCSGFGYSHISVPPIGTSSTTFIQDTLEAASCPSSEEACGAKTYQRSTTPAFHFLNNGYSLCTFGLIIPPMFGIPIPGMFMLFIILGSVQITPSGVDPTYQHRPRC